MEKLKKNGKVRSIGVSNYGVEELQEVLALAEIKPYVSLSLSCYLDFKACVWMGTGAILLAAFHTHPFSAELVLLT
jgi:hypothetical protein